MPCMCAGAHSGAGPPSRRRSEVEIAGPEQPDQADDDQVKGDDIVQQPGHDENENPGNQRYQGAEAQGDVHEAVLSEGGIVGVKPTTFTPNPIPVLYGSVHIT